MRARCRPVFPALLPLPYWPGRPHWRPRSRRLPLLTAFRPKGPPRSLKAAGPGPGRWVMGSLGFWRRALADPARVAAIEPDGTAHTAGDLLARVNQLTHGLRARGLQPGDGVAVLAPNGIAPLEVYLAALQAGWYVTPINWHFTTPEIAYIVRDSDAKAF